MLDTAAAPTSLLLGVGMALLAAGLWGTSDFGGGFLGRRAPLLVVLVVTQIVGFAVAAAIAGVRGEPLIHGADLALAVGAGILAAGGVAALYGGLAVGRMGVVAPVAAVLSAATPALIHFALSGAPHPLALLGMGIAIVAVVVVSRSPGHDDGRRSGIDLALVAGVVLGLLGFVLSRISSDYLLAPLAVVRLVQSGIFAVAILLTSRSFALPRSAWPIAIGVGAFDLFGNVAFLISARIDLATAAVVSGLYPVATVLLAATILRERITRAHLLGIGLAGIAIALIAAFRG